jgi:putative ABC transport system permease protein
MALIIGSTEAANKRAYQIFEVLGPDSILIASGGETMGLRYRTNTITLDDLKAIKNNIAGVYETIPMVPLSQVVKYKNKNWSTRISGTSADFLKYRRWELASGRIFTEKEVDSKKAVGIIGYKLKEELFPDISPIGQHIVIGRLPVKVIGVLKPRGGTGSGQHLDDIIVMPFSTVMRRLLNEYKYIPGLWLKTSDDVEKTVENIRPLLRDRHNLSPTQLDDFRIITADEILRFLKVLSTNLIIFLGSAGLIALIVGGFIIANLSYFAIKQRQKGIGIKRTYGAKKTQIMLSFLVEVCFATLLGGVLGVILAFLGGFALQRLGQIPMIISAKVLIMAFILSLAVGVISGLKPALKAAKVDPIRAIAG